MFSGSDGRAFSKHVRPCFAISTRKDLGFFLCQNPGRQPSSFILLTTFRTPVA